MPKVLVPIADNSEEIETSSITDVLTRGGVEVTTASIMPGDCVQVTMARGLKVVADAHISTCVDKAWDAIVLPGGMPGAQHLSDCEVLVKLLKQQAGEGKLVGAICAAPAVVLAYHGLLEGKKGTCYPVDKFKGMVGEGWVDEKVVVDGSVVTSQGPGTSLQFGLKLIEVLVSREKAEEVAKGLLTEMPK